MDNNSPYLIVDEPSAKAADHFIVNPIIILFAAILLPMFWTLPLHGRLWMPFIWLVFNGYCIGSATFKKEIVSSVLAVLLIFSLNMIFGLYVSQESSEFSAQQVAPYFRLLINATLFLALYTVVFSQTTGYQLYQYMRQND